MTPGIGEQLAEARRNRGLSVKDVEAAIKIRGKYISALEREDVSVIQGEAYVVAFLRSYASFLELDPIAVVAAYREQNRQSSQAANVSPEDVGSRRAAAKPGRATLYIVILAVVVAVAMLLRSAYPGAPVRSVPAKAPERPAAKEAEPKPVPAARKVTVELSTTAASGAWLKVSESSGTVLFEGILEPGKTMKWESERSIKVRSGKPSVVSVTKDGRALGPLNTDQEVEYKAGE